MVMTAPGVVLPSARSSQSFPETGDLPRGFIEFAAKGFGVPVAHLDLAIALFKSVELK